jgi:hypothetical protein
MASFFLRAISRIISGVISRRRNALPLLVGYLVLHKPYGNLLSGFSVNNTICASKYQATRVRRMRVGEAFAKSNAINPT